VRITSSSAGWDDCTSWTDDGKMLRRINRPIEEAARNDPGAGTGRPERLSGDLSGSWSRRIDKEHRLAHTVDGEDLVGIQARYHC
jgi:toxin YoeB